MTVLLRTRRALALPLMFPWLLFPSPPPAVAPEAPAAEEVEAGEPTGVVVESVGGWTLEKAGVQAGDVLLSWKRLPAPPANPEAAEGVLAGYFDWEELLIEQAPRGTVVLSGRRGEEVMEWTVVPGLWDAKVRPVLSPELVAIYERGKAQLGGGDVEGAVATWRKLVEAVPGSDTRDLKTWMLLRMGEAWGEKGEWGKAVELAQEGIERARNLAAEVAGWWNLGEVHQKESHFDAAQEAYVAALGAAEKAGVDSLTAGKALGNLGGIAWARANLPSAREYFLRAALVQGRLAPQSLSLAHSLSNQGVVAWAQRNLQVAQELHSQALEIRESLAPGSLDVANSLNNFGTLAWIGGNLGLAQEYLYRAWVIRERLDSDSLGNANSLTNLGALAHDRGEFDVAQDYLLRALEIQVRLAPHGLSRANTLNNLGAVLLGRGGIDRAHAYYLEAAELYEQLSPVSLDLATSLNNLGAVAWEQRSYEQAYRYHRRALRIQEATGQNAFDTSFTLAHLGAVAWKRGQFRKAEALQVRALRLREELSPQSFLVASSLNNLGFIAYDLGHFPTARKHYLRAVQLMEQIAPGSIEEANVLSSLGMVYVASGEPEIALQHLRRALGQLELKVSRSGGSYHVEASLHSRYRLYYQNLLDLLLLTQEDHPEAFQTLERYRAQTFLAMLAERDIAFSADIPEELDRERRRVGVLYDRTLKSLGGLNPRDHPKEIEAAREELRRLEDEAGDIEVQIRKASPRLAALRYPEPLDAERTREALDPGTLLLSWGVSKDKSALFTLGHDTPLEVHEIPLGEEALRAKVQHLLTVLPEARGSSSVATLRQSQLTAASRELFELLLGPAASRIAASERLLLLPDGPLHALPFGVLLHRTASPEGERDEYLAAWKPLHVALSATVYAELKGRRRTAEQRAGTGACPYEDEASPNVGAARCGCPPETGCPPEIAAFGDPIYPRDLPKPTPGQLVELPVEAAIDPVVRGATERGLFDWEPLPYTRREVEGIAALFPPGSVRTFLGAEALEERLKGLDRNTRILHLAAHAGIDEHLPSGSFIALTVPPEAPEAEGQPERDNGLLQVWEIVERVRLDADLVVLSACESGLGKELGGEGLIGLTRAFQYAGARSVVASLWSVNDQATAELMIRFYRHLRDGKTKDEALRAAQRELIEGPIEITDERGEKKFFDASAPYYWAAFQVYGDWR